MAAWMYRKRWPLASFGVLVFLLLLAPTSSFIPIKDVLVEYRVYLPFLGLVLISCEALRHMKFRAMIAIGAAALVVARSSRISGIRSGRVRWRCGRMRSTNRRINPVRDSSSLMSNIRRIVVRTRSNPSRWHRDWVPVTISC